MAMPQVQNTNTHEMKRARSYAIFQLLCCAGAAAPYMLLEQLSTPVTPKGVQFMNTVRCNLYPILLAVSNGADATEILRALDLKALTGNVGFLHW